MSRMDCHFAKVIWMLIFILGLTACAEESKTGGDVVMIEWDTSGPRIIEPDGHVDAVVLRRDAAPMVPADAAVVDAVPSDRGAPVADAADLGAPDLGPSVSNPFGGDGGMSLDRPDCQEEDNTCPDACQWVASCATGGACAGFAPEDLPLVYRFCMVACQGNDVFPEFVCSHGSCDQTVTFMNNVLEFRTACAGEGELTIPEPMVDPGAQACMALVGCLNACPDDGCANRCFNDADPEAQMRLLAVFDCATNRGCVRANGIINEPCMRQSCPDEMTACFGPPPQAMGIGGCGELLECFNACADQACLLRCVGDASPNAFALYNAALACVDRSGCPPNDVPCQQMRCAAEIQACLDDG